MRVSSERRGGNNSVRSKPMMRSWPICLWRSEVILVAVRDRARFLKKYLAPQASSLVFQLLTACAVGCILVPLRGYCHQQTERAQAATCAPHFNYFISFASIF